MTPSPTASWDWEKEPVFEALQEACIKGGADERALPHFVNAIRLQAQQEERKKVRKWSLQNRRLSSSPMYAWIDLSDLLASLEKEGGKE